MRRAKDMVLALTQLSENYGIHQLQSWPVYSAKRS